MEGIRGKGDFGSEAEAEDDLGGGVAAALPELRVESNDFDQLATRETKNRHAARWAVRLDRDWQLACDQPALGFSK